MHIVKINAKLDILILQTKIFVSVAIIIVIVVLVHILINVQNVNIIEEIAKMLL